MSKRNRSRTLRVVTDAGVIRMSRWCPTTQKLTYPDRIAADLALEEIQLRARRTIHDESRSYPCNHCPGWHLTSQEQRNNAQRIRHSA